MISLFTPEVGLIIWMLIAFLSVVAILGKYIWPSILNAVRQRQEFIAQGVENAQEAALRLQKAKEQEAKLLQAAHARQLQVIEETEELKKKLLEEMRQEAAHEKQAMFDQARQEIAQAKLEAMNELKKEVVSLSLHISEKILRKSLDTGKANEELISRMLEELETKN